MTHKLTPAQERDDGGLGLRDRVAMEHLVRTLNNNAFFCAAHHTPDIEVRQSYIQQHADNAFRAADAFMAARQRCEEERVPLDYRPHKYGPWQPAARLTAGQETKEGE